MTNNEAEYKAVFSGLDLAKVVRAVSMVIHYNSWVVVGHVNGEYEAKGERMKKILEHGQRQDKRGNLS